MQQNNYPTMQLPIITPSLSAPSAIATSIDGCGVLSSSSARSSSCLLACTLCYSVYAPSNSVQKCGHEIIAHSIYIQCRRCWACGYENIYKSYFNRNRAVRTCWGPNCSYPLDSACMTVWKQCAQGSDCNDGSSWEADDLDDVVMV